ncbi:MAG: hypothetical protein U0793_00315 [Gemmataceae bacterium]
MPRLLTFALVLVPLPAFATDYDLAPINYTKATPDNVLSRLQDRLDKGKAKLAFDEDHGFLKSVLTELNVPLSSQVLVFSKTSFQRDRIAPKTPRALYFNDDIYIGFCQHGDVVEVSAVDPRLGAVFYTLDQQPVPRPRFVRHTDECLSCHGSTLTKNVPGHLVRSLFPDRTGNPILSLGSTRVDHTTPFEDRWGGWYVTGTHGKQVHRGNRFLTGHPTDPPRDNPEGVNVTDLKFRFTVANYLTPHSDLVALMVLEHQVEGHNRIARAGLETRVALHQQAEFDRILDRKTEGLSDSTARRIQSACEPLVRYLLFSGEAKLSEPIVGTSSFAADFAARGPKDAKGRSLRDFDLKTRLFKHPCSYLIHSEAFRGLPAEAKDYVLSRIEEVLTEQDRSGHFDHLSTADRQAIREILLATGFGADGRLRWR